MYVIARSRAKRGDVAISCFDVNPCTAYRNIVLEIPTVASLPRNDILWNAKQINYTLLFLPVPSRKHAHNFQIFGYLL